MGRPPVARVGWRWPDDEAAHDGAAAWHRAGSGVWCGCGKSNGTVTHATPDTVDGVVCGARKTKRDIENMTRKQNRTRRERIYATVYALSNYRYFIGYICCTCAHLCLRETRGAASRIIEAGASEIRTRDDTPSRHLPAPAPYFTQ